MSYIPSDKEFETVIQLDIEKRVKRFVNMAGGHSEVWMCHDDEGNLFAGYDTSGKECVSIWPAKKYAEWALTETKLKTCNSIDNLNPMELHKFLEEYIDELTESNIYIMVFPTDKGGAIMTAESFRNMMQEELDRME